MGFNAERAGYADAGAMIEAFVDGEDAQVQAMATYIAGGDEADALRARRWEDFAAKYNGPSYKKNRYDEKLAGAFAALSAGPLPDLRLRTAQLYLTYLGYNPKGVDGVMGRNTRDALRAFQTEEALAQTGQLDDATENRLRAMAG
jgi:peptidoglycan hydrolase-like protein with peptidoglycan-binding domain